MKSALIVAALILLIGCGQRPNGIASSPAQPTSDLASTRIITAPQATQATLTANAGTAGEDFVVERTATVAPSGISYSVRAEASNGMDLPAITSATASELTRDGRITVMGRSVSSDPRTGVPFGTITWEIKQSESSSEPEEATESSTSTTVTNQGRTYVRLAEDAETVIFVSCIGTADTVADCDSLLKELDH